MKDKSLKQISTNIIPQGNVPNVPAHLQTGTYYPPTPPPIANPMGVAGMEAQNDMTGFGMGNQMGTYPLAQTERTGQYYDKSTIDYTGVPSDKIPTYEKSRKINKLNLMAGRGPNLDSPSNV